MTTDKRVHGLEDAAAGDAGSVDSAEILGLGVPFRTERQRSDEEGQDAEDRSTAKGVRAMTDNATSSGQVHPHEVLAIYFGDPPKTIIDLSKFTLCLAGSADRSEPLL